MEQSIQDLLNLSADECVEILGKDPSLLHARQKAAEYMIPHSVVQIQVIVPRDDQEFLSDYDDSEMRNYNS